MIALFLSKSKAMRSAMLKGRYVMSASILIPCSVESIVMALTEILGS